ncbi:PIKK family atypical protein kinase [Histomonas meleagridis]|uniref:PIKK family atypical protein kinase n=1 Tax=Histomonas meleagridis TaxID=135588 RepID=UPI00355A7DFB|nr:PIKK family atypical protein kinase [Histomonas meleagridis]KAH0804117.1 PIKK family atypical protein kinase [Histomonas meleagridis]
MILQNFEKKDPDLLNLADFLDRCGYPLKITEDVLADASESTAFALFYLQRYHNENPKDIKTIANLLKLNSRMGRIDSARGLLVSVSNIIDPSEAGKWGEELGEWEKALEIYESQHEQQSISCFLRCYAHLELWDKIRENVDSFEKMSDEEKKINAIWFAWAFYHSRDFELVQKFVTYFQDDNEFNSILFQSLFLISSENYNAASECILRGFKVLSTKLSVFNGNDDNKASQNMVFAQHLIELQEVLSMKQNKLHKIPNIWQYRLQSFSSESDAWTKLIEIRSLVLSPAEHIEGYLKMLSVLRKERRWKIIDAYCTRFFSEQTPIYFLISQLKIKWARGFKTQAESLLERFNMLLNSKSIEENESILSDLSQEDKQYLLNSMPKASNEIPKKERARLLRLQAAWQYQLRKTDKKTLLKICDAFERSNELISDDYRTWAGWAYTNSSLLGLSNENENIKQFTISAIDGFLKATKLRQNDSLEFLCQVFSIFFRYGEDVELPQYIVKDLLNLSPATIIQIIPQIVVHIAHKGTFVRQIVSNIIETIGEEHFQAVIFPLNILSLLNDGEKASIAQNLIYSLGMKHPDEFEDVQLFIDGMHRAAISIIEKWLSALDMASHAFYTQDNITIINIMNKMISNLDSPQCEDDQNFLKTFNTSIQRVRTNFESFKKNSPGSPKQLWESFRILYTELDEKMKVIDTLQLNKISKDLANKRGFCIAIPGTYSVDHHSPLLDYIMPTMRVLSTQKHPRTIFMIDEYGTQHKYLLKGNEDLRLDQRIMQFFTLINSLLQKSRFNVEQTLSIEQYSIIPFAPNAGLISWVNGADTFQELVIDFRTHRNIPRTIERDLSSQIIGKLFSSLNSLQRMETFEFIDLKTKANELREILWLRSPNPTTWLQRNRNFTKTTALMSMAGYIIGLGDRHPSNIMIQRHTGRVIHIDFGDSFEVALHRKMYPERVPFRLTRMIQNALDGSSVEGVFRSVCEDVMYTLRENQSSITAQLEVFIHEPIFLENDFRSTMQTKNILDRVVAKLSGRDPTDKELDVAMQVDTLIKIAKDPMEYVRHYIGWCPFW